MIKIVTLIMCTIVVLSIFPIPKKASISNQKISANICNLNLQHAQTNFDPLYYFNKLLKREFGGQGFDCSNSPMLAIILKNEDIPKQAYSINIKQNSITLGYSTYNGYVYAMETLFQMIEENQISLGEIYDEPAFQHRGIMIDSIRHFLSIKAVKRTIQALPLSKLNVLHWHLSDDEAFPFESVTHPQLYLAGSYDKKSRYSYDDIKQVIDFAKLNAVIVIPQIDTPAHVRAWGLSDQWKQLNITIKCGGGQGYNGQFDLSKNQTFKIVQDVVSQINSLFSASSEYIHLGGDEVSSACWNLRPQIQKFMASKNISSYGELQMYWRNEIRKVLPQSKKVIYWRNTAANVSTSPSDILHYWGAQNDTASIVNSSLSKLILSPSDYVYLNSGQGFITGNKFGHYSTWREIYTKFTPKPAGVDPARILGAQACLWGQVSNEWTLDNNLWMRASAFAETVWTDQRSTLANLVERLVSVSRELNKLGVQTTAIVPEFCENYPSVCFPPAQKLQII